MPAPVHSSWLASKWRYRMVFGCISTAFLLAILKSGSLQLNHGEALKGLAEKQYKRTFQVAAARGMVYDREGRTLAGTVPMDSVYVEPRHIVEKEETAEKLSEALSIPTSKLEKRVAGSRSFAWIQRRIPPTTSETVRQLGLRGVGLLKEHQRFYPNHSVAGQLLGTVSIDGEGQSGIERAYDSALKPKAQRTSVLRDAKGNRLMTDTGLELSAFRGNDVHLTIDAQMQQVAELALVETVRKFKAKSAWAIAMDPKTGEILVMANAPTFNPNTPGTARRHSRNQALSAAFEPGSTMKTITFAAALEAGVVHPEESIDCENGKYKLGRHTIRDSHKSNWLTVRDVFKHSSNIGTLKIALAMGEQRFKDTLKQLHFGERLGLGLAGEARGRLPRKDKWGQTRLSTISFGHGLMVTSVQMLAAVGTVANDGVWVQPHVIQRVTDAFGEEIPQRDRKPAHRVFKTETAKTLAQIMQTVVEPGGTGTPAAIPGIAVAGKTGTAEKVDPVTGRYSKDLHLSSFIGFAPADDPEAVVLVVVDEPQEKKFGGLVAGPAFRKITEAILRARGIFAAPSEKEIAELKEAQKKSKVAPKMIAAKDVAPVLAVEEGAMPDLRGMTLKEALVFLKKVGVVPQIEGHGLVKEQMPQAGAPIVNPRAIELKLAKEQ